MRNALSIRVRLALVYGALLAVTLIGFDVLLYWTLLGNLSREFDDSLRVRAAEVAHALRPGAGGRLDASVIEAGILEPASLENSAEPGVYVQVFDAAGQVLANSGTQLPVDSELLRLALGGGEAAGSIPVGDEAIRALLLPGLVGGEVLGAGEGWPSLGFPES